MQGEDKLLIEHLIRLITNFTIVGAVVFLISIFLIGYVLYYMSYFKKKGDNLATKEDIADITKIVEDVKSEVEIAKSQKISLSSEKRKAILEYNEALFSFKNRISFLPDDFPDNDKYDKVLSEIEIEAHKYVTISAKVELLVDDDKFIQIKNSVDELLTYLRDKFETYFLLKKGLFDASERIRKSETDNKINKLKQMLDHGNNAAKEFVSKRVEINNTLNPVLSDLRESLRLHLQ